MDTLKVKRLTPTATLPTRATHGDAGLDLYASESMVVIPGVVTKGYTGIAVEIPHGYVGLIHPRSGLAAKHGITVVNAPGTIDAGYRGELVVLLTQLKTASYLPFGITAGERIAQLVIQKVELPEVEEVEELSDSVRGAGGFGSTGV